MKTKKVSLTIIFVAVISFITIAAFSHGNDSRYNYGHMMGPGNDYMMGPGYGHMGRGYMHDYSYNNIDDLKAWLDLSEEQVKQISKIDSEYREKFYNNRGDRDKIYELRKEYNKEFEDYEHLYKMVEKGAFDYCDQLDFLTQDGSIEITIWDFRDHIDTYLAEEDAKIISEGKKVS